MSSGNDVRHDDPLVRLDAGTQALVRVSGMRSPLDALPVEATENLLVVSSTPPAEIAATLTDRGANPESVGLIPVSGSAVEYDGPMWVCDPVVPDDLTGLSMRVTRAADALEPGHGWLLFEPLNALLMYADSDRVLRFLDHTATHAGEQDLRGVYTITRDAVGDDVYAGLRRSVDREVELG